MKNLLMKEKQKLSPVSFDIAVDISTKMFDYAQSKK